MCFGLFATLHTKPRDNSNYKMSYRCIHGCYGEYECLMAQIKTRFIQEIGPAAKDKEVIFKGDKEKEFAVIMPVTKNLDLMVLAVRAGDKVWNLKYIKRYKQEDRNELI